MTFSRTRLAGRDAFIDLLASEGVTHLFGNPGTTELPIMHALGTRPQLRYVLGMQESIVVAMADGYARATGELVACNVHVAPGLGNAMGSLFTAAYSKTPMIITAGQQEQGHGLMEPLLAGPLVRMAEPLVKWAIEVTRLADLPRIMRRAAKIATTAPTGPVFISLPGDILNASEPLDLMSATRLDTVTRPSAEAINRLAERLINARSPVILAGPEIVTGDAFDEAGALALAIGAPVWQQTVPSGAHFPSAHPCYLGGLSRNQSQVRAALADHDLLISLGADMLRMSVYSETDPMPQGLELVHIGLDDHEIGKNWPVATAWRVDLRASLRELLARLEAIGGDTLRQRSAQRCETIAAGNWSRRRVARTPAPATASTSGTAAQAIEPAARLNPDFVMYRIAERLPADAIVVEEGLVSTRTLLDWYPYRDRHGFFGNTGGGIGWAISAAIGIALGQPARPVFAIIGDGSAMYSIQALWTAAHLKLPITYIIANNQGYRIIKERLRSFHGSEHYIAMDFDDPPLDFVSLARGLGMPAERIDDAGSLEQALTRAIEAGLTGGPRLLDVSVDKGP